MVRKLSPEKRQIFLDTALKLFAQNGVANTSTNTIAMEAGTAAGTLFLYFPTKQDLINTLVLKISKEQAETIESRLDLSLTAQENFRIIWQGSIEWFSENMEAYHYTLQVRDAGIIDAAVVEESQQYLGYYFTVIQKALAENAIKPYPLELIGNILYQQIVGVMDLIRRQPDQKKQEEYISQGFEIFWNGIRS
ncbi:MAG: TetR/AcrR family transcriptional regulator [Anaerolineales bacterium]